MSETICNANGKHKYYNYRTLGMVPDRHYAGITFVDLCRRESDSNLYNKNITFLLSRSILMRLFE